MVKIAIVGSRNFKELKRVDEYLNKLLNIMPNFSVITGGAIGVDKKAEKWCLHKGIKCEVIRPINPQNKIDYLFRNVEILTKADKVLVFWDKSSRGTAFTIKYTLARNKKIVVFDCEGGEIKNEDLRKLLF